MPDHLSLPQYSDKFITENNSQLVRCLHAKGTKGLSINELKWQVGLRSENRSRESRSPNQRKSTKNNDMIINEGHRGGRQLVDENEAKEFGSLRFAMAKN